MNSRELALMIWLGLLIAWGLTQSSIRSSAFAVLRSVLTPKLSVPLALLTGNVAILCAVGSRFDAWNTALAKDTVVWFIGSGTVAFGMAVQAKDYSYVRSVVRRTIAATVLVEFFTNNIFVFPLAWELVLQPVLFLLVALGAVAETESRFLPVKRLVEALLAAFGLAVFAFVVWRVTTSWTSLDGGQLARELVLPLWMAIGVIPFLLAMGLLSAYEQTYLRLRFAHQDRRLPWYVGIAVLGGLNVRIDAVARLRYPWLAEIAGTASLREAWLVVRKYRREVPGT
ncbi:MAG: hypothetical protein C4558_10150 [Dehalococcoidia bacterium]|nr:MAG: hypothetical protein C4558_10150 [Dehalococcoidia bacterium]